MPTKHFRQIEIKNADRGLVLAKFGTTGVKDLDGDVIEKGAIGKQAVQISAFGHTSWSGSLPVGKGVTREDGDALLADLEFFMDTTHGRDHFLTVKALGELGEWSVGFDITSSRAPTDDERQLGIRQVIEKMNVFEVSPVLRGAGIDTGTLAAKCVGCGVQLGRGSRMAPDELRAARRGMEEAGRILEASRARRPGSETELLAKFAVQCAHELAGYPGQVAPPEVRWFPPDTQKTAYMLPGRHVTWLASDRRGEALVESILHEAKHHAQSAAGTIRDPGAETEAASFARKWAGAVAAAFRWSDGASHRVRVRKSRPPFHDARGYVVLAEGGCYVHHAGNAGPSWTRSNAA